MAVALVELSEQEMQAIDELARQTGKSKDELLRAAIMYLIAFMDLSQTQLTERRALLRQARGIWKDRADLPDLQVLRSELDRYSVQE